MGREGVGRNLQSSLPRPKVEREEQLREVNELKKALSRTRQELLRTKEINRSSSDEEGGLCVKGGMSRSGSLSGLPGIGGMGSRSGSINALSSKPSLNRELVTKLRSMTETIKMLSSENVALRTENESLISARPVNDLMGREEEIEHLVKSYENQLKESEQKIKEMEKELEKANDKDGSIEKTTEKDKYKALARRLKEERNTYKNIVEEKKLEQDELKVEIEKMTDIIGELRRNCGQLQDELEIVYEPGERKDKGVQTSPALSRRASSGDIRIRGHAKRSRSTVSPQCISRQQQLNKSIELSKPKPRGGVNPSPGSNSTQGPSGKGPKIAKPVSRAGIKPASPGSKTPCSSAPGSTPQSPRASRVPGSRTPGPSPSKIPTPSKTTSKLPKSESSQSLLQRRRLGRMSSSTSEDDSFNQMDVTEDSSHSRKYSRAYQSMEISEQSTHSALHLDTNIELKIIEDVDKENPVTAEDKERNMEDDEVDEDVEEGEEFPAPPPPEDLAKLSMEAQFKIVSETVERACDRFGQNEGIEQFTPRTTRKVDSFKEKLAARRIQRTWKHFYQELEEKKAEDENSFSSLPILLNPEPRPPVLPNPDLLYSELQEVKNKATSEHQRLFDEEEARDSSVSSIQAAILGQELRSRGLSFLREGSFSNMKTRGGIYTARPWMITSESESEEDDIQTIQGIVRSHSFRLGTINEGDVFRPGKVRSIREKFTRESPDGESDNILTGR
ncbi:myosin-2 heavy chain isoform X2 [Eurytemora carolleeae]|uniref:myosin-2 heavy chain isoform X2 n=1 Tax=Eurytemora carolleeae TaxID=1294199 RepID=UPI000C77BF05|nr:myosin-2 heavy chain isoform X2 [Eurytemora carolleeae]|eukprot:XP_023349343.1 myosin-2 heavy chain-like isoform X2 [Eurytemora affinis]